jgi:hypothetical protein
MLLIVAYPTLASTRAAAAAGNELAAEELRLAERREQRLARAERSKLREPDQLPDLAGSALVIDWDFEERDGETWTILRHEGRELWGELAFWEGYERFAEVFEILRRRYGGRLAELRPTPASEMYLYGDRPSTPALVKRLNASLDAG